MNKKIILMTIIILFLCITISLFLINTKEHKNLAPNDDSKINDEGDEITMIKLSVNDKIFYIEPENNSSSIAFIEKLKNGEIIIAAEDYGNFEKVGDLGFTLPTNDKKITTEAGDLILYQGNKITLYYDTNTWTFTKLGKVKNVSQIELKQILGPGSVTLKFSL